MIRPKQFGRMGEFYLEEAILDVLLEAKHENECLGAAAIGVKAGIFRESGGAIPGAPSAFNDAIVTGMLIKLLKNRKVRRCTLPNNRQGYELTDEEFQTRRDDS